MRSIRPWKVDGQPQHERVRRCTDLEQWKAKRDGMCAQWTFSTDELAAMYGISAHRPYMEPPMVDWAITHTQRYDCIGIRPIRLKYGQPYQNHITGKVVL